MTWWKTGGSAIFAGQEQDLGPVTGRHDFSTTKWWWERGEPGQSEEQRKSENPAICQQTCEDHGKITEKLIYVGYFQNEVNVQRILMNGDVSDTLSDETVNLLICASLYANEWDLPC